MRNHRAVTGMVALCLASALTLSGPVSADTLGKKTYELCIACHSITDGENGLGPSLQHLIGRTAGTSPGFRYSGPMKRSGIVWNSTTLRAYLRNPQETVPGTRMPFSGMTDEVALTALVGYLNEVAN